MWFNVTITADTTVSTCFPVEAETAAEAEAKALAETTDNPSMFEWTQDEGNPLEPYLPDPGNCAEKVGG